MRRLLLPLRTRDSTPTASRRTPTRPLQVGLVSCPFIYFSHLSSSDRLCGLVVKVLGYRSGGLGLIPGTTKKKVVVLGQGPLSLVSTTEELRDRKVAAPV
jgi:hypothetical protein